MLPTIHLPLKLQCRSLAQYLPLESGGQLKTRLLHVPTLEFRTCHFPFVSLSFLHWKSGQHSNVKRKEDENPAQAVELVTLSLFPVFTPPPATPVHRPPHLAQSLLQVTTAPVAFSQHPQHAGLHPQQPRVGGFWTTSAAYPHPPGTTSHFLTKSSTRQGD